MQKTLYSIASEKATEFLTRITAAVFPVQPNKHPFAGYAWTEDENNSTDPAQWREWLSAGHSLAMNAGKSRIIVVDIDAKGDRDGAWKIWCELCAQWGMSSVAMPAWSTPSGGWHVLFRVPDDAPLLRQPDAVKGRINVRAGNGYVVCPPSSGYVMVDDAAVHDAPPALVAHCTSRATAATAATGRAGESDTADLAALVAFLAEHNEFDDYESWVAAGMALRIAAGEAGLDVWRLATWDDAQDQVEAKWASFKSEPTPGCVTIATLIKRARELGFSGAVRRSTESMFGDVPVVTAPPIVPAGKLIMSDAEFVADFKPPSYLLDGILQRRYCYAMTAATGAGKTAIALLLAACVGLGRKLGDREVQQGVVCYFASENAVDVQARWIAMAQHCGFEIGKTNVKFVSGATRLSEIADRITSEAEALGDLVLVVVDTSQATFEGDDENSNVHAIEHAKRMRSLTLLNGGPTVLVLAHPTKRAAADDLIPRGGGAFLAEIDGNLCARKSDSAVELHWCGKFRGMDFAPMLFRLDTVTAERLKDERGRLMPTVIASPLDDAGRQAMAAAGRRDEDVVLGVIEKHPGASSNDLAKALGWTMRDGRPYGVKVRRAADRLAAAGMIHKHRDAWALTSKGEIELNAIDGRATGNTYILTPGTSAVPPFPGLPPRRDL